MIKIMIEIIFFFIILLTLSCQNNNMQGILDGNFIERSNEALILLSPADKEVLNKDFILIWIPFKYADKYVVEVSNDETFGTLILNKESITEQLRVSFSELPTSTSIFYWRVKPYIGRLECKYSDPRKFNIIRDIIYVSISSTSSENGYGSSNEPFKNINDAVEYANQLESIHKIYVAEGTYTCSTTIRKDVELYGGFSKADWNLRDINIYKTLVLPGNYTTFSVGNSIKRNTIIDGFYYEIYGSYYESNILISMSASPVISNCFFTNLSESTYSTSVSVAAKDYSFPLIKDCSFFITPSASIDSLNAYNSFPIIQNCTFNGDVSATSSSIDIQKCIFNNPVYCSRSHLKLINSTSTNQITIELSTTGSEISNNYFNNNIEIRYGLITFKNNFINGILRLVTINPTDYLTFENNIIYGEADLNNANGGNIAIVNNYLKINPSHSDYNIKVHFNYNDLSSTSIDYSIIVSGNVMECPSSPLYQSRSIIADSDQFLSGSNLLYIVNNTIKIPFITNSTQDICGIYLNDYYGLLDTYIYNNIFVDLGNTNSNVSALELYGSKMPTLSDNVFVGTSIINHSFKHDLSGTYYFLDFTSLSTLAGTTSNTFDYDYTNVFNNISDTSTWYILKSTATCAIDKGYNCPINGTNISDFLVTDITSSHSRLSGTAIDIGAYEYQ